jgi:hypothetical protein
MATIAEIFQDCVRSGQAFAIRGAEWKYLALKTRIQGHFHQYSASRIPLPADLSRAPRSAGAMHPIHLNITGFSLLQSGIPRAVNGLERFRLSAANAQTYG